jgi:hypothetical protein
VTKNVDPGQLVPRWGLVANVVATRIFGEEHTTKQGASQFLGGAKVHYHSAFWGVGGENVTVVGHHRSSHQLIRISMEARHLENWRVKVLYQPALLRLLEDGEIRGENAESEAVRIGRFLEDQTSAERLRRSYAVDHSSDSEHQPEG